MSSEERARELLVRAFGAHASFRDGQIEAVLAVVDQKARCLLVQRTGWGKSVVYFLATALLRQRGSGPTIMISPLISLMRDQLRLAGRLGVHAATLNSQEDEDRWQEIESELAEDRLDILIVSPERLANERFRGQTLGKIAKGIGLLVVDEAHCISDWGHDFRPDYRRIGRIVGQLPTSVPLLATTATANDRVIEDIVAQLGSQLQVVRGPLARDSLCLQVIPLPGQAERLAWLAEYLTSVEGSGVIYVLTQSDAHRVSRWLATRDVDAPAYTARVDGREQLERRLLENDVKALVATVALGMGFDKPDLAFVVHYQRPGSPVAYYQQIGRAGRSLERAEVVLLAGEEDDAIADYFIENAFPPERELRAVLEALERISQANVSQLERELNMTRRSIERALKLLEVEGAVTREGGCHARTPNPWSLDSSRIARVTEARERERERMTELVQTDRCLMSFIRAELDDPVTDTCGRCANCVGEFVQARPSAALVWDAVMFLRRAYRPIEPRKRWPSGLPDRSGAIPLEHQLREGRTLSVYGDSGWGSAVKRGKYRGDGFDDSLVEAICEMLERHWQPDTTPTWMTAVPSRRSPDLVADFARRVAKRLGIKYRAALEKVGDAPKQKSMENSYHQAANALASFRAVPEAIIAQPVFLVDDMVDSRWSLTVCGVQLAEAGSGPVVPLALAETSKGAGT